ncbi:patatin-like phospholipase family protein [Sandaracinobacter sp. RS1-74]|uniref:patatin-like phospholipase family protein n=1 Tax=Sandaracinobacteroides sayramensis TaxID=2913411 RepID=UPI001EDC388F|nr:patatin-like phospholipase family protein [Sandaracinobacteroides sayramensis]MCG2839695.1 patatin-like phospholipase family protein [Sandaracinobacteroides sayramensis]
MRRTFLPLFALLALAAPLAAETVPQPAPGQPRIGLVLGGGGARGFAHVGVLQVLEENRIPVHAVAGTSMGAVVGSLYAQGKTPAELTAITEEIPWTTVFNDSIPRDRLSFRRKRDQRDVLIDYRISFDNRGLVLPKGVLRGQDLFLTLAEYLAPARSQTDFDLLAIPYRAVAADIETGRPVVMDSGDIATAVFASMSVPGGLPPVERDGRLLVDGGIVDNVPIDVGRAMGVDHLIVVDVGTPLLPRDRISSFVSVLNQMQLLLGRDNIERQVATLTPQDVLIRPDQPDISTTGFEHGAAGIAAGRAAALAALEQLRPYQLSEGEWQAHLAARQARAPRNAPVVDFVKVDNRSDTYTQQIEALIQQKPGQPLDARQMTEDLHNVYALGGFRAVRYGIGASDRLGGEGVTITADGDPTAANWLQVGLGISTDFNRHSAIRLGLGYTDRNFMGTGAEWRTDVRVGTNLLIASGFYTEFGSADLLPGRKNRMFAEITPYWSRIDTVLYEGDKAVAEVRDARLGLDLDGGFLFGNHAELRFGVGYAQVDLDTLIGIPADIGPQMQDAQWRVTLTADTLDQLNFPTEGLYLRLGMVDHVKLLGGDLGYTVVSGELWKPVSWGRNTILFSGEFGFTSRGDGRSVGDFRLGGFLNLSGLDPDQLLGRHKLLGRAIFFHRLSEEAPIVNVPVYLGGSVEVGNTWSSIDDVSFSALRPAASLFAGTDTPLGPFVIAGGLTRGNGALYLVLGRIF